MNRLLQRIKKLDIHWDVLLFILLGVAMVGASVLLIKYDPRMEVEPNRDRIRFFLVFAFALFSLSFLLAAIISSISRLFPPREKYRKMKILPDGLARPTVGAWIAIILGLALLITGCLLVGMKVFDPAGTEWMIFVIAGPAIGLPFLLAAILSLISSLIPRRKKCQKMKILPDGPPRLGIGAQIMMTLGLALPLVAYILMDLNALKPTGAEWMIIFILAPILVVPPIYFLFDEAKSKS